MNSRNCNCEKYENEHVHELTGSTVFVNEQGIVTTTAFARYPARQFM